tara:strand:+ start:166 stop:663 length:498 start_codon:yes stop_codon:yes gene_type:complete
MASGDLQLVQPKNTSVHTFQVAAGGASTIQPGEPVAATPGTATVALAADATPAMGTDYLIGIATTDSTDTAAAAGTVECYVFSGGEMLSAKTKAAASADTLTEIRALANDFLLFDLTSTNWTVDAASGHAITGGLIATGEGEPENSRIYLWVRNGVTFMGSDIAA